MSPLMYGRSSHASGRSQAGFIYNNITREAA